MGQFKGVLKCSLSQVSTVPVNTVVDESEETGRKWKRREGRRTEEECTKKGEWRLGWQVGEGGSWGR